MKLRVLVTCLTLAIAGFGWNSRANAIGCISGGVAGAVAGHMAHHGVLGAIGGCVAGHTLHKHQQQAAKQDENIQTEQSKANGDAQ